MNLISIIIDLMAESMHSHVFFSKAFSFHSTLLADGNNRVQKSRADQNDRTSHSDFAHCWTSIVCTAANKF